MQHAAIIENSPPGYEIRRCRHCQDQPYQLWRLTPNRATGRIVKFGQTRGELFRKVKPRED